MIHAIFTADSLPMDLPLTPDDEQEKEGAWDEEETREEERRKSRKDGQNRYKCRVNQCTHQTCGARWISC